MTKTYFKWYLFAAAALFIILLSAQPWKWLAANADEQGYIDLVIEKTWEDADNADSLRPSSIRMQILQNDTLWREVELTAQDGWRKTITDAPETDSDGNPYDYTIREITPEGYTSDIKRTVVEAEKPIEPDPEYTVTYTDGVPDETVFEDQQFDGLRSGASTPAFDGTPSREGYTFRGWKPAVSDTVTGDAVYTAQWTKNEPVKEVLTVTWFDEDGVTILDGPKEFLEGDAEPSSSVVPAKQADGEYTYQFREWVAMETDGKNKAYKASYTATPIPTYTVTYTDGADGSVFADQNFPGLKTGDTIPSFDGELSRDGYLFTGWTPEPSGTVGTSDITYTATWVEKAEEFTVTWIDRGTTLKTMTFTEGADDISSSAPAPGTPDEGYRFAGWSAPVTDSEGNITFEALWERILNTFTLSFDTNGGSSVDAIAGQGYDSYEMTIPGVSPVKKNCIFLGWSDTNGGNVKYQPGGTITLEGDMTLYAVWEERTIYEYTLTLDDNTGNGSPSVMTWSGYDESHTFTFSDVPVRDGYTFLGWSENRNAAEASYTQQITLTADDNDVTLYAVWERLIIRNTFTLQFDANGGSNAPGTMTEVQEGSSFDFVIPTSVPDRNGFTFLGWAEDAGAASATYQAGGTVTVSGSLTLYAVWEKITVPATIDDLSVSITGDSSVFVGDEHAYTLTISNSHTEPAMVDATIRLPEMLDFVRSSIDCTVSGDSFQWDNLVVPAGRSVSIQVWLKANDAGSSTGKVMVALGGESIKKDLSIESEWEEVTISLKFVDKNGKVLRTDSFKTRKNAEYDAGDNIDAGVNALSGTYVYGTLTGDPFMGLADSNKNVTVLMYSKDEFKPAIMIDKQQGDWVMDSSSKAHNDYTIVITNEGNSSAWGMSITDTLTVTSNPNITYSFRDFKMTYGGETRTITPMSGGASDLIHELELLDSTVEFRPGETVTVTYSVDAVNKGTGGTINTSNTCECSWFSIPGSGDIMPMNVDDDIMGYSAGNEVVSILQMNGAPDRTTVYFDVTNTHVPEEKPDVPEETYTITYKDGTPDSSVFSDKVFDGLKYGDRTPVMENPQREGYTFAGWTPDVSETVTGNAVYTAVWQPVSGPAETYTVTYTDGVPGKTIFPDEIYDSLTAGSMTPAFEGTTDREGYTFTGWTPDVSETVTGNATYTASWEQDMVSENITCTWDDQEDADGKRPDSLHVDILQDGEAFRTVVLTEDTDWMSAVTDLPGGHKYTIKVADVPEGYTVNIKGFDITAVHVPETRMHVTVKTVWDDDDNKSGLRPASLKLNLLDNGTVCKEILFSDSDGWETEFVLDDDFDRFKLQMPVIPEGYMFDIDKDYDWIEGNPSTMVFTVTGSIDPNYRPSKPSMATLAIEGIWEDDNDADGLRPDHLDIDVLQGTTVYKKVTLTEDNAWRQVLTEVPVKDAEGNKFVYSIKPTADIAGYDFHSEVTADGFKAFMEHEPSESFDAAVQIFWDDENNKDKLRPASVTIELYQNDVLYKTADVDASMFWKHEFKGLPVKDSDGHKFEYDTKLVAVPEGYTSVVDGFTITNTHEPSSEEDPAVTDLTISAKWDDMEDADSMRPDSVDVSILKNGAEFAKITLNKAGGWKYDYKGLPVKDKDGTPFVYTVKAADVPDGYKASVNGYEITYTHVPKDEKPEVTKISVSLIWDDAGNKDRIRPDSVRAVICRNGKDFRKFTLNAKSGWKYTCDDLPLTDSEGSEYTYTVKLPDVPDKYEASIDGYKITLKHVPAGTAASDKNACGCDDKDCKHRNEKNYCKKAGCCSDSDCCKDCKTCKDKAETKKNACGCDDRNCKYKNKKDHCKNAGCCKNASCCKSCDTCKSSTSGTSTNKNSSTNKNNSTNKNSSTNKNNSTSGKKDNTGKQTVSGNNATGKGEVVKTGEETFVFAGIAGLVILSGCGFWFYKKRRK